MMRTETRLTTAEGWRRFAERTRGEPPSAEAAMFSNSDTHRQQRINYHRYLPTLRTPQLEGFHTLAETVLDTQPVEGNDAANPASSAGAKAGLALSGPFRAGKTTIVRDYGRLIHRRAAKDGAAIPVIYALAPPATGGRSLIRAMVDFLGLPVRPRAPEPELVDAVAKQLAPLDVRLIIIDDAQNLQSIKQRDTDAASHLKAYTEQLPVPFLLAGQDLERTSLFHGSNSDMIGGRMPLYNIDFLGNGTKRERGLWIEVLRGFEGQLRLARHQPGVFESHADYIFERTGGSLSTLAELVSRSAVEAILSGNEAIDLKSLESTWLNYKAQIGA